MPHCYYYFIISVICSISTQFCTSTLHWAPCVVLSKSPPSATLLIVLLISPFLTWFYRFFVFVSYPDRSVVDAMRPFSTLPNTARPPTDLCLCSAAHRVTNSPIRGGDCAISFYPFSHKFPVRRLSAPYLSFLHPYYVVIFYRQGINETPLRAC